MATTYAQPHFTYTAGAGIQITVDTGSEDDGDNEITITATGGAGGHTIQDDDVAVTARTNLSFQDGFVVTDDAAGDQTELDLSYEGTPSTQAFGDTATAGTAITATRGDHKHAMPADPVTAHVAAADPHAVYRLESADHTHATTGLQAGQVAHSALSGITATDHHSNANDHTQSHDHSAAGDGTTLTPAILNVPATITPAQTADGQAVWDSDGNFLTVGDGVGRQTFLPVDDATSNPLAVGTVADGTEASFARKDHVHPTGAGTPSTQAFGDAADTGAGPAAAMTNHKHAMMADPVTAHVAAADPHTGYRLESADHTHQSTGAQAGQLDHGLALTGLTDDDHTQYLLETAVDTQIVFSKEGTLAVGTGTVRWYNDTGRTLTFASTRASVGTQPTGASILIDVNKDGTTIFTTQASRPTIAVSTNTDQGAAPDVTTIANGSYITVDIDQIGSTIAGADLSVQVWMTG